MLLPVAIAGPPCHNQVTMASTIWTIGHSTRPIDELLGLLRTHEIGLLVDVRTVPRSRYNPQFNRDTLAHSLHGAGVQYRHLPELGGLRKPTRDSINQGWRNDSFRGYADYMQTGDFQRVIEELMAYGTGTTSFSPAHPGRAETRPFRVVIMCAEAVPWRCHRSLIADMLTIRGWAVRHIVSGNDVLVHSLTPFAVVQNGTLTYPGHPEGEPPALLF